MIKGLMNAYL